MTIKTLAFAVATATALSTLPATAAFGPANQMGVAKVKPADISTFDRRGRGADDPTGDDRGGKGRGRGTDDGPNHT